MPKNPLIITILLSLHGIIHAQSTDPCQTFLTEKVFDTAEGFDKEVDVLYQKLWNNYACLDIDSIDAEILFQGPILGSVLAEHIADSLFTYQALTDELLKVRDFRDYEVLRKGVILTNQLKVLNVTVENWEQAKELLLELRMKPDIISQVEDKLVNRSATGISFHDLVMELKYNQIAIHNEELTNSNPFNHVDSVNVCSDYKEAVAISRQLDKRILIFFTGYACINCRKMEEYVFSDRDNYTFLMDNFVLVQLYVDDRTALSETEIYSSSDTGKIIDTIGKKNAHLQRTLFNANTQPLLVVIDADETERARTGYTKDPQEFHTFLKSAIK